MLEEFIDVHNLSARILAGHLRKKSGVKVKLFLANSSAFLVLFPAGKKLSIEKLAKTINLGFTKFHEATEKECLEITGYKKNFLVPVSIFGVKLLIDSSLKKFDVLYFFLENDKTLEIPLTEIIEFNDDLIEADLIE